MDAARVKFLVAALAVLAVAPAARAGVPAHLPDAFVESFRLADPAAELADVPRVSDADADADEPAPATIPLPPALGPGAMTLAGYVLGASLRSRKPRRRP